MSHEAIAAGFGLVDGFGFSFALRDSLRFAGIVAHTAWHWLSERYTALRQFHIGWL